MKDDEEQGTKYMWMITHDTAMKHFTLELHTDAGLSPRDFIESLYELVEKYDEDPQEMFDNAQTLDPQ